MCDARKLPLNIHIWVLFLVYYVWFICVHISTIIQFASKINSKEAATYLYPLSDRITIPKNFLFYLFPKFFCTNKLFAQASNWLSCKFEMLSDEVSYRTCTYPLIPNAFSVVLFVNNPKLNDYQYSSPRLFWFKFHKSMLFFIFIAYQRLVWS